ncbi:hypothetical protein GN956_G19274 [Arapaima gigas]
MAKDSETPSRVTPRRGEAGTLVQEDYRDSRRQREFIGIRHRRSHVTKQIRTRTSAWRVTGRRPENALDAKSARMLPR